MLSTNKPSSSRAYVRADRNAIIPPTMPPAKAVASYDAAIVFLNKASFYFLVQSFSFLDDSTDLRDCLSAQKFLSQLENSGSAQASIPSSRNSLRFRSLITTLASIVKMSFSSPPTSRLSIMTLLRLLVFPTAGLLTAAPPTHLPHRSP